MQPCIYQDGGRNKYICGKPLFPGDLTGILNLQETYLESIWKLFAPEGLHMKLLPPPPPNSQQWTRGLPADHHHSLTHTPVPTFVGKGVLHPENLPQTLRSQLGCLALPLTTSGPPLQGQEIQIPGDNI